MDSKAPCRLLQHDPLRWDNGPEGVDSKAPRRPCISSCGTRKHASRARRGFEGSTLPFYPHLALPQPEPRPVRRGFEGPTLPLYPPREPRANFESESWIRRPHAALIGTRPKREFRSWIRRPHAALVPGRRRRPLRHSVVDSKTPRCPCTASFPRRFCSGIGGVNSKAPRCPCTLTST
jgi:hypothetical protein